MTYIVIASSRILHPAALPSTPRPLTSTRLMHNLDLIVPFAAAQRLFPLTKQNSGTKPTAKLVTAGRKRHLWEDSIKNIVNSGSESRGPGPSPSRPIFARLTLRRGFDVGRILDGVDVELEQIYFIYFF